MDPAEESLLKFERLVDKKVASFPVWNLPLRSILSALFLSLDGLISRGEFELAGSLISRISLLCPFLKNCNLQIGSSAEDALSVIGRAEVKALKQAVLYAHFCELMPEVRHGRYSVKPVKRGFWLTYREQAYQAAEEFGFIHPTRDGQSHGFQFFGDTLSTV